LEGCDALSAVDLDVALEQPVATLSGGEQQRLSCARALLRPVELLLADEPTGALDAGNRDVVLRLLQDRNQAGVTVVVVTHDPAVVRVCGRTLQLGQTTIGLGARTSNI
jgi:putative ABC transport system ATP-binding protein